MDSVNKGVTTVGANSKAMAEKMKVKMAINNLEKERLQLLQILGQRVYEMVKDQNADWKDENLVDLVKDIDKNMEHIADHREQLTQVEEELNRAMSTDQHVPKVHVTCQGCGYINDSNTGFCTKCNNPIGT